MACDAVFVDGRGQWRRAVYWTVVTFDVEHCAHAMSSGFDMYGHACVCVCVIMLVYNGDRRGIAWFVQAGK